MTERQASQGYTVVRLWCALAAAAGVVYGAVVIAGKLLGSGLPVPNSVDPERLAPVSNPVTLLLAILVTTVACWIAWRPRWAAASTYQQQRGKIVASISTVLGAFVFVVSFLVPLLASDLLSPIFGLVLLLIASQIVWLVRRGHVSLAGALLTAIIATGALSLGAEKHELAAVANPMVSALAVLVSGLLVRWWFGLAVALALPLFSAGVGAFGPLDVSAPPRMVPVMVLLLLFGAIVALYARALEAAMRTADARDAELTAASAALRGQNAALERQAARLRTTEENLRQTVADQQGRIAEAVAELRLRSVELSSIQTPLIRIAHGVLVVPLIGAWDDTRADVFTQSLMHGVEQQRARIVVLDLTGLAAMSEGVARMVLRTVAATRLLGCRCVLVGVQPESAQALVSLGIDLSGVETGADLADGVALSLGGDLTADRKRISR